MKKMLQLSIVVLLLTTFSTADLMAQTRTFIGKLVQEKYGGFGMGLIQQKNNNTNFNILDISLLIEGRKAGFNRYIEGSGRFGITQILSEWEIKNGTSIYYADDGLIGIRAFALFGGSTIPFMSFALGAGVSTQINVTKNIGLVGEYGYRETLKVWDIGSKQWYMSGSYVKIGVNYTEFNW